jgi:SAM-dependent methyltransferase
MLTAAETNHHYFHEAYSTGRHGWEVENPSPYVVDFLDRLRALVPGGRLLDLGCGEGRHSLAAARAGFRVVGVDYEPLALHRARRTARAVGLTGITFRQADALHLPFPAGSFDVVLDYGCLHHQRKSDWPAYRAGLLRVLKPRGYYVLSVFSPDFPLFHGSRRPWHLAYGSYRRYFTREDLEGLFGGEFEFLELVEQGGEGGGFWHALAKIRQ